MASVFICRRTMFCDGVSCLAEVNGEFLYYDQWHLRLNLKPETRREFAKALYFDDIIAAAVRGPAVGSGERSKL